MIQATLCFLLREEPEKQILLGLKKRGLGKGKFNGFGGKVEEGENPGEAALRELEEEVRIKANLNDITKVGELTFHFPFAPSEGWNQTVHVFLVKKWEGEPVESEEMRPMWVDTESVPFERMWQDDRHWLPLLMQNKKFKGRFVFKEDNESIQDVDLEEIDGFTQ